MKILIADDEELVRRSIVLFLRDMGVEEDDIAEADNGLSMLRILESSYIDLALVDICMPDMDGLEAIRRAKEKSPSISFYVLSGFDDFKYAKEALRLGVKDYLLKPLKRTEMELILEETISLQEKNKSQLIQKLRLSIMSLLNFPESDVTLPMACHPLLILHDVPNRKISLTEMIGAEEEKIIWIPWTMPEYQLVFLFETPEYPGYYGTFLSRLIGVYADSYTIIEGKEFRGSRQWNADYRRMAQLAKVHPAYACRRFYKSSCRGTELPPELERLCLLCEKNLRAYSRPDYVDFSITSEELIRTVRGLESRYPRNVKNILEFLRRAYQLDSLSSDTLEKQLLKVSSSVKQESFTRNFKYDEITAYIANHYMEDLTLSGVASLYGLSSNYFSALFKKKAGCNFVSYLTRVRMNAGKRLLLGTDRTIREIAESVGYYSTSFFIRTFKKMEQMTPTEYRKKYAG